MTSLFQKIDSFFFSSADFRIMGIFRFTYCFLFFLNAVFFWTGHLDLDISKFHPIPLIQVLGPSAPLSSATLGWLKIAMIASLLGAAIGYYARFFLISTFLTMYVYVTNVSSYTYVPELDYIPSGMKMPMLIFLLFCFIPDIGKWKLFNNKALPSYKTTVVWPIQLIKLSLGLAYLSAGIEKLASSGEKWMMSETLQAIFLRNWLVSDNPVALILSEYAILCQGMGLVVLVFQLTFIVGIFHPKIKWILIGIGIGFHGATSLFINIHFIHSFCFAYLLIVIEAIVKREWPLNKLKIKSYSNQ